MIFFYLSSWHATSLARVSSGCSPKMPLYSESIYDHGSVKTLKKVKKKKTTLPKNWTINSMAWKRAKIYKLSLRANILQIFLTFIWDKEKSFSVLFIVYRVLLHTTIRRQYSVCVEYADRWSLRWWHQLHYVLRLVVLCHVVSGTTIHCILVILSICFHLCVHHEKKMEKL